ncbi:MAG: DUF1573 domain-containing protein [Prevotellaceae bacterium]|jgi:hypothetical protein|nr:DUF1573 domain-containing protein [Prevotellaceae bacterium]
MKKIVLLLLLFNLFSFSLEAQKAKIEFATTKHDFGNINEADGEASYTFTFKNAGNAPLVIQNVEASCGCTSPEWTKEPVLPGKSGKVKATFDPSGRLSYFDKKLTVTSNAENSKVELTIVGNVVAKVLTTEEQYPVTIEQLRLKSNTIEMYRILSTGTKTENLEVLNTGTTPVIINFENVPEHISLKADPVSLPAGTKGTIKCTYNALKKKDFGQVSDDITLRVKSSKITLKVTANIAEDFSNLTPAELEKAPVLKTETTNYQFNKIKSGSKVTGTFEIKNEGKSDLIIHKITNACDCVKSTIGTNTIKPGKTTTVSLELTADETGEKFYGTTLITNAPQQQQFTLYMIGTVE